MSDQDHRNKPNSASNAPYRRKMLLGGTTLAAASALGTVAGVQKAVAESMGAYPKLAGGLVTHSMYLLWLNP